MQDLTQTAQVSWRAKGRLEVQTFSDVAVDFMVMIKMIKTLLRGHPSLKSRCGFRLQGAATVDLRK